MPQREEAVTALVVDARQAKRGAAEFEKAMQGVTAANAAAVKATERVEQVTANQSRAFGRLRSQLDPTYAAQQRLERGLKTLNRAMERGNIDTAEHTRLVGLLEAKFTSASQASQSFNTSIIAGMSAAGRAAIPFRDYNAELLRGLSATGKAAAATRSFGKSTGLASFQVLQLGQQFQDFGIQVAGGQNPLLAIAQQGSQAAFIMGGFGASIATAKAAVRGLTATMFANPLFASAAVATAGIAAIAGAILLLGDNTDAAADAQKRHKDAMEQAREVMQQLEGSSKRRIESLQAERRNLLANNEVEIMNAETRLRVRKEQLEALQGAGTGHGGPGTAGVEAEIKRLNAALETLEKQRTELRAQLGDFETGTAKLGETHEDLYVEIKKTTDATDDATDALARQSREVLKAVALVDDGREKLARAAAAAEAERVRTFDHFRAEQERFAEQQADAMQKPFDQAAENIQDAFGDTFKDIFRHGLDGWRGFWDAVKDIAVDTAAQIASLMVFRPVVAGIAGGISPSLASGFAGSGVGGFGGLGNLTSFIPTGGITSAINSFGAGLGFANGVPIVTGPGGLIAGGGAASTGAVASSGFFGSGATLAGTLGAAGIGALGGGLLASLTGGSQLGGSIGGGLGAGIGFAVGGPIGGILGGLGGSLLGGLFGGGAPKQKSITPVGVGAGGLFQTGNTFTSHSDDITSAIGQAAAGQLNALLATVGGTISNPRGGRNELLFYGRTPRFMSIVGGVNHQFGDDEQAAQAAVADFVERTFREAVRSNRIEGVSDSIATVLRHSINKDLDSLTADVNFAKAFDQLTKGPVDAFAESIKALNTQFDDAIDKARALGLSEQKLQDARADAIQNAFQQRNAPLQSFLQSLSFSELGGATPAQQLVGARASFEALLAQAQAGSLDARSALAGQGSQLLQLSRQQNASGAGFQADRAFVRSSIQSLISDTSSTVTAGEREQARLATIQINELRENNRLTKEQRDTLAQLVSAVSRLLSAQAA